MERTPPLPGEGVGLGSIKKGQNARTPLQGEGLGPWRPASTTPRRTLSSTSATARWSEVFRGAAEFENS
eukprot:348287-Pyramimonas_sp.AAC.1